MIKLGRKKDENKLSQRSTNSLGACLGNNMKIKLTSLISFYFKIE